MLSPDKPPRLVSQAPLKETNCYGGCGAHVQFRTTPRIYCPPCKVARRKAVTQAAAEVQRRKRGVPKVKGSTIACARCATVVVLNRRADAKFCKPCALEVTRERSREVSRAKAGVPGSRDYHNAWYAEKRRTDARYAINFRFRAAVRRVLNGGKRGRKWESLVGYTLADLMIHLERQFLPGMTWDNRGDWEIDHISPLAAFKFESAEDPEFRAAWALANLRPIRADDNRKKNRTRTHLI